MFKPVRRDILRWGTPDPEMDQMMYGHLILNEEGCVLVDPPYVPGLLEEVGRLGRIEAVIITTLDHARGARYIQRRTGASLYLPDQVRSATLDPEQYLAWTGISNYETYGNEELFGLKPFRITVKGGKGEDMPYMDERALLTDHSELIAGDIAVGTENGELLIAPEWFPNPHEPLPNAHDAFRNAVLKSGADSLLAPHCSDLRGNLKKLIEQIA